MYGALINWMYGALINWMYRALINWMYGALTNWMYGGLINWMYGALINWMYGALINWMYGALINWMYGALTNLHNNHLQTSLHMHTSLSLCIWRLFHWTLPSNAIAHGCFYTVVFLQLSPLCTSKTPKEPKYESCFAFFVSLVFFRERRLLIFNSLTYVDSSSITD